MSARSYQNVNARMYGGEIVSAVPLRKTLLLSGGASYTHGGKDPKPSANVFDTDLSEMPPLKAWVGLRYNPGSFFTEINAVGVNRQGRVDSDVGETPTAGYGLINLKAGIHVGKLYATAFVDNLLNRHYYESYSYLRDPFRAGIKVPEPGRSISLPVSYSFCFEGGFYFLNTI